MSLINNPLTKRTYKYKNAHMEFFCPLCNTQRAVVTDPHLSPLNYLQIFLVTVAISACLYPFMGMKGIFSFFVVWTVFEAALRINFRKEVPCPHCGFDASWYKKDVNVARRKVDEFWQEKNAGEEVSVSADDLTHTQSGENLEDTATQMM